MIPRKRSSRPIIVPAIAAVIGGDGPLSAGGGAELSINRRILPARGLPPVIQVATLAFIARDAGRSISSFSHSGAAVYFGEMSQNPLEAIQAARDAYDRIRIGRNVVGFRGGVQRGTSGGPVLDRDGNVVTTVFARRHGAEEGYGVPNDAVKGALGNIGPAVQTACVER